jgi:hypothetical protein
MSERDSGVRVLVPPLDLGEWDESSLLHPFLRRNSRSTENAKQKLDLKYLNSILRDLLRLLLTDAQVRTCSAKCCDGSAINVTSCD